MVSKLECPPLESPPGRDLTAYLLRRLQSGRLPQRPQVPQPVGTVECTQARGSRKPGLRGELGGMLGIG